MKKCPYCAEEIQDEAIVCRYCGRELAKPIAPQPVSQPTQAQAKKPSNSISSLVGKAVLAVAGLCTLSICLIGVMRLLGPASTPAPTSAPRPTNPGATVVINVPTSTAGPTPTTAPTVAPTQELGKTRDNPLPRDAVVDIGGDIEVMITNVQRPANDIVEQGNMFNATPVPNAEEYIIVKLHVECKKPTNDKCNFDRFAFKTVGTDSKVHDQASVAGIPLEFEPYAEFFGGGSLDGTMVFLVAQGDTDVVLFHDPLIFGDPIYISLQP